MAKMLSLNAIMDKMPLAKMPLAKKATKKCQ